MRGAGHDYKAIELSRRFTAENDQWSTYGGVRVGKVDFYPVIVTLHVYELPVSRGSTAVAFYCINDDVDVLVWRSSEEGREGVLANVGLAGAVLG